MRFPIVLILLVSINSCSAFLVGCISCAGCCSSPDDTPLVNFRSAGIRGFAFDKEGNFFFSDLINGGVYRTDKNSRITKRVVGAPPVSPLVPPTEGPALTAIIADVHNIVFEEDGNLLMILKNSGRISRWNVTSNFVSFVAGNGNLSVDGVNALETKIINPEHIVLDPAGNIVFFEGDPALLIPSRIRIIDKQTNLVTTLITATFSGPLIFDRNGNIFYTEKEAGRVFFFNKTSNSSQIFAGSSFGFGGDGGPATSASLRLIGGLLLDLNEEFLYISEQSNNRIRRVNLQTRIIETVAGTGNAQPVHQNIPGAFASFNSPLEMSVGFDKNTIIVSDSRNNMIRLLTFCNTSEDCGTCFDAVCDNGICRNATQKGVNALCDNGIFCDGPESCDVLGQCVSQNVNPCVNLPCLGCNEDEKTCRSPPGSSCSIDGTFQNAAFGTSATCQNGLCSIETNVNSATPIVVGITVPVLIIVIVVGISAFIIIRRKRRTSNRFLKAQSLEDIGTDIIFGVTIEQGILGRGNFGNVFKGEWNGTAVALKQISNGNQEEILKEVSLLHHLRHPNIVTFFGIFHSPTNGPLIALEFMDKGSLRDLLADDKITDIKDLKQCVMQTATGMAYLESRNVLHCDLAARNLLVSSEGNFNFNVKVADFGMGKRLKSENIYQGNSGAVIPGSMVQV